MKNFREYQRADGVNVHVDLNSIEMITPSGDKRCFVGLSSGIEVELRAQPNDLLMYMRNEERPS